MRAIIDEALRLAAIGWPVFPCGTDKRPHCKGGFRVASTDLATVRQLFTNAPNASNIGVPTGAKSDFDVLDVDTKNGGLIWEQANRYRLPETRIHRTPSGGVHYLFRHAAGMRCNQSVVARGIDVRGDGGYACFPPVGGYSIASDADVATWPAWLVTLAQPPKAEPPPAESGPLEPISSKRIAGFIDAQLRRVATAPDGQKHFTLLRSAISIGGVIEEGGISPNTAARLLLQALPVREDIDRVLAGRTIADGLARGQANRLTLRERPRAG